MTPERWSQVNDVLHGAMEVPPDKRADYLDHACAADSALRREVESLLAADEQARTSFLESAPLGLTKGTRLGDYEVRSKLGAGGMGEVYRALDLRLRREVAIKILPGFASSDPERLRRFEQEALATAALNDPNILAVYQMGTHEGAPYLVSELLEGETLRELVTRGRIALRKAIDFGIQITRGLAAAHNKGIVHRDLKPENLFVTKDGRAKILDFGLAKLSQRHSSSPHSALTVGSETEPGRVMGTVGYMSPEQVRGQSADHRADIFAFGAILYEMLTGQRAFQKPTSAETMASILNEEPPPLSQTNLQIPPGLQRVVHRCLEKNQEHRFQSASDLTFALEALSDSGSSATHNLADTKSDARGRRIAVAAVGVLAGLSLVLWLGRSPAVPTVEAVTQVTDDGEQKWGLQTDGTRIYFSEGQSGSGRLEQVSVTGGDAAELPTHLVNPAIAAVSKDGSQLLVLADSTFRQPSSLWYVPVPSGAARRVGNVVVAGAGLFPDGRIVYTLGKAVYFADHDGSNAHKLVEVDGNPESLSVSPDGKRIAFTSDTLDVLPTSIYEVSSDGTGLHRILNAGQDGLPSQICCARWTPNAAFLVFLARSTWRWDLWALPQNNFPRKAMPVRLTNGPLSYGATAMSPDGRQLFAVGNKRRGEAVRYDLKTQQLVPYFGSISAFDFNFSRDGKWVVYLTYPDHALWRSRPDGSDRLQLSYPPTQAIYPRISSDGSRVTFSTPDYQSYMIGINGGTPQKVTENAVSLDWSPDGNTLTFTSIAKGKAFGEPNQVHLRTMDLISRKIFDVPGSEGKFGAFYVNQDTMIAVTEDSTRFFLLDLKTGTWSDFFASPDTFISWKVAPDGKYLYCATAGPDPKILRINVANHKPETLMNLKNVQPIVDLYEATEIDIAPDGSPVFARDRGTEEIYALSVKWP
jgi:serine/threonine protein kinase/Tol biopolymer transport system component